MFRERKNHIYLILSANLMITLCFTGCRSGMSRMNMFGLRSEPSAEALAGNGPTTTYPAPPGESATPQAIASIAAGTAASSNDPITLPVRGNSATAQVAGMEIDPGYVVPAGSVMPSSEKPVTNMAAAQANGIFSEKSPRQNVPDYAANVSKPSAPSGYQYGSKGAASPMAMSTTPPAPKPPTVSATSPASNTPPTSPNTASSKKSDKQSGFTMPDIGPGVASAIDTVAATAKAITPPAAAKPEYSISSSDEDAMIPAIDTGAPSSAPSTSAGGYTPGSTAGAVGYPVGGFAKPDTKGGSFYR